MHLHIIDQICLGTISIVYSALSLAYLFLFSIPHSTWITVDPAWHELAVKMMVAGSNNLNWMPAGDERNILLIALASTAGTLGFDRNEIYYGLYDYWGLILTVTSIFAVLLFIASISVGIYTIKGKWRHLLLPWILLAALIYILSIALAATLMYYLQDRAREVTVLREGGRYLYAQLIVTVLCWTVFHFAASFFVITFYFEAKDHAEWLTPFDFNRSNRSYRRVGFYTPSTPPTPPPGYAEAVSTSPRFKLETEGSTARQNLSLATAMSGRDAAGQPPAANFLATPATNFSTTLPANLSATSPANLSATSPDNFSATSPANLSATPPANLTATQPPNF